MTTQESNYLSSDLSDPKYSYDLVVGTTAQAINATMKQYLFKYTSAPTVVWYGQSDAGAPIVPMQPLPNEDPFATPDKGTPPTAILNSDFVFAIKASFGLPQGMDPLSIPDILILSEDQEKVTYQLFFNTFEIVTLEWGRHGSYAWSHYTQPEGNPYLFQFLVDMNFDAADPNDQFSKLDAQTQQRLKALNQNSNFSVQQLYLDLNNAGLQMMPTIEGIPADSPVYDTLHRDFINTYWKAINDEGKFILGYTGKANTAPVDAQSSIQPTDLNFKMIPHYDENGNKSNNYKLYTLNYLMTSENRPLKLGAPFSWNWVTTSDVGSYHGAMAVRRAVFANFLNQSLSAELQNICIKPTVTYEQRDAGLSSKCSFELDTDSSPGKFTYVADSGAKILELSYSKEAYAHDKSGLISGHFGLTSAVTGNVSVSGTEITVVLAANMNINFDNGDLGDSGVLKGLVGGYNSTIIYVLAIDGAGKLTVSMKDGYPQATITPPKLDKGVLTGIDGVNGVQDQLKSSYSVMAQSLAGYAVQMQDFLNQGGSMWVFPGGRTFTFKDAAFSDFQDLVTHITYADPS